MSDLDLIYGTQPKPTPPPTPKDAPDDKLTRKQRGENARQGKRPPRAATSPTATNKPAHPQINQSINRPVNQSINRPIDTSPVLGKPKGFYITGKQDEDLDEAVKRLNKNLEGKVMMKIDRSIVLRLVLDEANLSSEDTIERLSNQLINRLINQLTNK